MPFVSVLMYVLYASNTYAYFYIYMGLKIKKEEETVRPYVTVVNFHVITLNMFSNRPAVEGGNHVHFLLFHRQIDKFIDKSIDNSFLNLPSTIQIELI